MSGDESSSTCFFKSKYNCSNKPEKLIASGSTRIQSIIECSKTYDDTLHDSLQEKLDADQSTTILCHKSCVSNYTSKTNIKRHTKRKHVDAVSSDTPTKITRRSTDISVFSFQHQCLFCGDRCDVDKDPKNPSRWRPAYICRETDDAPCKTSFKQSIIDACAKRNDVWAERVRLRVEGAISDLHAADARYHIDCRAKFLTNKPASKQTGENKSTDMPFEHLVKYMRSDPSKSWNSVELFETYSKLGGSVCSRRLLVKRISEHLGNEVLVLHSSGLATLILFRGVATKNLRLTADEEDDTDYISNRLSKAIVTDIHSIKLDKKHYAAEINKTSATKQVSKTLMQLLTKMSPKLDNTLPAILIGSMITSVIQNNPTGIQVALGVKMGRSKLLISMLHDFGITCTYDEVQRFKRSAAVAATENSSLAGISDASSGLVQVVADNFDADISSQNGKLSTHSLAVIITQPGAQGVIPEKPLPIRRITQEEMYSPIEYDVDVERYNGPSKPAMPHTAAIRSVLPLKVLCQQVLSITRAEKLGFAFLKDVIVKSNTPEFNGYNTAMSREQGKPVQPQTNTTYLPLIDMTPSHPDTMMTAMAKAQGLTQNIGQKHVIFTCDLQLYKVALDVKWAYPDRFENVILRLGGMHSLMSFIGAVGTLMSDSGLSDVMTEVFGGVAKMLTGKKIPQNVRAMRLVAEELLRCIVEENQPKSRDEMMILLEQIASQNKTAKLWIDVFLAAVFIMMLYVRAEREGDWSLHLTAYRKMLPYFFAAGHIHYARYGVCYLKSMESLPTVVLESFLKGEHVMRHQRGLWNGIWSDMLIESTFMRYGYAPGGIIGITLKPDTLKVWALSLHNCSQVETCIDSMINNDDRTNDVVKHKEEGESRIQSDAKDREVLQNKLKTCINPVDVENQHDNLVNIVSGEEAAAGVNVHDSIRIGSEQMIEFENNLPEGLHATIHKKVQNMSLTKKHVKVGQTKVFDTTLIYSRVLGLHASGRDVDIKNVLSHELAPFPTALFDDFGEMRIAKSKSALKKQLQTEVSDRMAGQAKVLIIDGSALLWVISYPADGLLKDYLTNIKSNVADKLKAHNVYLVFDRYFEYSTKSSTRCARATGASRTFHLNANSKLPPQKVLLTVTKNKSQLIDLIFSDILDDSDFIEENTQEHKLVVTAANETPIEFHKGKMIERNDLGTKHEEADNMLVQQVLSCVTEDEATRVTVVSDDTDVFVLLVHYYHKTNMKNVLLMESPIRGGGGGC